MKVIVSLPELVLYVCAFNARFCGRICDSSYGDVASFQIADVVIYPPVCQLTLFTSMCSIMMVSDYPSMETTTWTMSFRSFRFQGVLFAWICTQSLIDTALSSGCPKFEIIGGES